MAIKIMRQGSPCYVADWVKDLTKEGRAAIGQNRIMDPYSPRFRKNLTRVEYTAPLPEGAQ